MKKLVFFFITLLSTFLVNGQDKNRFSLKENEADIEQIITAVIENDSINVRKNNDKNIYIVADFERTQIITNTKERSLNTISLKELYNARDDNNNPIGFQKKDALYLLSQNKITENIKLPKSILDNSNVLNSEQIETVYQIRELHSFYTFSLPIIAKDKTKAYVVLSHHCGFLCGEGIGYFLQKKNGKWEIIKKELRWIS